MGENLVKALKLLVLFVIAISLLGAGVWTYQGLQLIIGLAGIILGVSIFLYTGYNTYRFASEV